MIPFTQNTFRQGATVSPERINECHRRFVQDFAFEKDQRWYYFPVRLDFRELSQADNQVKRTLVVDGSIGDMPGTRVVGMELSVYSDDAETFTVSSNVVADLSVVGRGDAQLQAVTRVQTAFPLSSEATFELDCSAGTWSVEAACLTLWMAVDRFEGVSVPATAPSDYLLDDADDLADARTKLNAFETAYGNICDESETARAAGGITIVQCPELDQTGSPTAWDVYARIPKRGRTLVHAKLYAAVDTSMESVVCTITEDDGAGATLATLTIPLTSGSTTTYSTAESSSDLTQANSDSDSASEDWALAWSRSSYASTMWRSFVILYWE